MAEEKKKKKNSARRENVILMIVSAVFAITIWTVLSLTAFPDVDVTIHDVQIDFSLDGSYADLAGLSIIERDYETANITFTGRRDKVSNYGPGDVHIALDTTSVRSSGAYNIPLVVTDSSGAQLDVVDIVPQSVHVVFDVIASKELSAEDGTLRVSLSGIRAAQGYAIDPNDITITPSKVTIYGPQDYLDQVTSCVISLDPTEEGLNKSVKLTPASVELYSGNAVFNSTRISYNKDNFSVNIPVYYTKNLPLSITLIGYNDRIDVSSIHYALSTDSIVVRSENDSIEDIESISLGTIDIRDIRPGYIVTLPIPPNAYYTNISGIEEVEVRFDLEGYTTKSIMLPNRQVHVINEFADYNMTVEQDRLRVEVVGPEEILNELDASNFIGQIDAMDYGVFDGQRFLTVSVYAQGYPNVWSYGVNQMIVSCERVVSDPQGQSEEGQEAENNG